MRAGYVVSKMPEFPFGRRQYARVPLKMLDPNMFP
jgi:hypothetical protein